MSYQVVKGWPSDGAIDEMIEAASGVTLTAGTIAAIDSDGNGTVGNYSSDGSDADEAAAFIIDKDEVTDKFTVLMSPCLLEVDSDHYAADTYAVNDVLTAASGVFAKPSGSERVVGKVISINSTTGTMRILWSGYGITEMSDPGLDAIVTAGLGASGAYASTTDGAQTLLEADSAARVVILTCVVTEAFADGTGGQPTFTVGETDTATKYAATTVFADAALGAVKVLAGTLTADKALLVTGVPATGNGTGAIAVSALVLPASS
jgi:hypothetical protein